MKLKQIIVRSRGEARAFDPEFRYLVISISDPPPDGEPLKVPKRWGLLDADKDVLHLAFHDVDVTRYDDAFFESSEKKYIPMHAFHAKQVVSFLNNRLREGVEAVLVHCQAGVSRSPSIAMAIVDGLGLTMDRRMIDWTPMDPTEEPPNLHVYETMIESLTSCST